MSNKGKKPNPNKIGIGKFWGWNARAVSVGCVTVIYGTYFMLYCTNALGLSSAIVGTLLLVSKLFDGITDLFAGYLIDNTNTKLGKARPYEFAIIGVWLFSWLLFSCPANWSNTAKYALIFVLYTLINSVFVTLLNVNQSTYMVRSFSNQQVMMKLNAYGGIVITIGCAIVSMTFPMLVSSMATSAAGWSRLMLIYCIPLTVIGMLRFLLVKETVVTDEASDDKLNLQEMKEVLKKNKYVYLICIAYLFYNIVLGMNTSSYYFTYVVGDLNKYTSIAALSMPLMLVMFVFPVLMKKMKLSRIVMLGAAFGAAGYLCNFLAGSNMTLLMAGGALGALGGLPIAYVGGLMILDCGEYNTHLGLPASLGTMTSFQSFASKVGAGVGTWLLGILLSIGGFISAGADGVAVMDQPDSAITMIRIGYGLVPAIFFIGIFIVLHFYKLEDVLAKFRQEKAEQK